MNQVMCPECGKKASEKDERCYFCGFTISEFVNSLNKVIHFLDIDCESSENFSGLNRRKYQRLNQNVKVKLNDEMALLLNVSETGVKLSAPTIPTLNNVRIHFYFDNEVIEVQGNMVWFTQKPSFINLREIGIYIKEAPNSYLKFIQKLLKEKKSPGKKKKLSSREAKELKEIFH